MGCTGSTSLVDGQTIMASSSLTTIALGDGQATRASFHNCYVLDGKLGRGAFAQVHLARGVARGEEAAVKITDLRTGDLTPGKPDYRKLRAAQKEATILRKVAECEHCVQAYEDFADDSFFYLVMERCDHTLLQVLERLPEVKEYVLARLASDMLRALNHIHSLNIVHRDVKPDNFLCCGFKHVVKLCDFGLAEVLSHPTAELKGVYGTAPFMSPEMLKVQGYGTLTDVWSLGVILYTLLFGQFPYQPVEATTKAMKAAIIAGQPQPTFKPKLDLDMGGRSRASPGAVSFLRACLCRDPGLRISARDALGQAWVSSDEDQPARKSQPSLRPMLYAARRAGAFDVRKVNDSESNSMDIALCAMQAKYRTGGCGAPAARRAERPTTSECDTASVRLARTDSTTEHTNLTPLTSSSQSYN